MLKQPNRSSSSLLQKFGFGVKVVIVLEGAGLIGSYLIWRKMNNDQEFRYLIHQKAPYILDYYYKVGETLGSDSTRTADYANWGVRR